MDESDFEDMEKFLKPFQGTNDCNSHQNHRIAFVVSLTSALTGFD